MPRHVRIQYEGAIYHVMNRGDHFEAIVRGKEDRQDFLKRLEEACLRHEWSVHAFVIMSNHYHLLVETRRASLVKGMKHLDGAYTQDYKRRHRLRGHLFQGGYKALLVDGGHPGYLRTVADYIHMNPIRAGVVRGASGVMKWRWCSAGWLAGTVKGRPEWMRWERVFGEHGWEAWDARTRQRFRDTLVRRVSEETSAPPDYGPIRRGWCYGADTFREKLKEGVEAMLGGKRHRERWTGEAVLETEQERAGELLEKALGAFAVAEAPGLSPAQKMVVALWIRQESGVCVRWLVDRLKAGTESGLRCGMVHARRQCEKRQGEYPRLYAQLTNIKR